MRAIALSTLIYLEQGVELSQENKDEINNLVLSSIRGYLQPGGNNNSIPSTLAAVVARASKYGANSNKRVGRLRRRRKVPRSPAGSAYEDVNSREPSNFHQSRQQIPEINSFLPTDGVWCHDDDTPFIRQSVEQQAPHVEVSLDGLWLPSLQISGGHGSGGNAARQQLDSRWAEPAAAAGADGAATTTTVRLGTDQPLLNGQQLRSRPTTVASTQVRHINNAQTNRAATSSELIRSGAMTAGRQRHVAGGSSATTIDTPELHSRRNEGTPKGDSDLDSLITDEVRRGNRPRVVSTPMPSPGEAGHSTTRGNNNGNSIAEQDHSLYNSGERRGRKRAFGEPIAQAGGDKGRINRKATSQAEKVSISEHTEAMLERSRALVAKAKVGVRGMVGGHDKWMSDFVFVCVRVYHLGRALE